MEREMSKKTLNYMEQCIPIFSILQDKKRQEITELLFDNGELSVMEITERISLSRPAVSHHLKLMLGSKIVKVRQEGKERYYSLSLEEPLEKLKNLISSIENDIKVATKK